jgi:aspartate carbamoyltransferase catalytic subunit
MTLQKQPLVNEIPGDHTDAVQNLIDSIKDNPASLFGLANQSILSARQFNREMVIQLCNLAAKYEKSPIQAQRPLTGKILISAFYEPSTRTRLSFESAWHRLGGDVMSITDPLTTGIAKGESHKDVAEMLSAYGDIVVLRDPEQNTIYEMMESLRIPVINAGNGAEEHPTQALADMYAIFKWRPELMKKSIPEDKKVRVAIVGVPSCMRTVRSLLLLLSLFPEAVREVVIISDADEIFAPGQREEIEERGLKVRISTDMNGELPDVDVIYINAIAWVGNSYEQHGVDYRLNMNSPIKEGAIVLHPLARGEELCTDLDATSHNWYFDQARGAVYIRMALLTCYVWLF